MSRIEKNTFIPGLASKVDVRKVEYTAPMRMSFNSFDFNQKKWGYNSVSVTIENYKAEYRRLCAGWPSAIYVYIISSGYNIASVPCYAMRGRGDKPTTFRYQSAPIESIQGLLRFDITKSSGKFLFWHFALDPLSEATVTQAEMDTALNNKVDKVTGKGLSANDFTDALKAKLEGLRNYDDTALNKEIDALEKRIDTLVGGSASEAIDTFNEIEAFLAGISDTSSLTKMLSDLRASVLEEIASQDMTEAEASEMCDTIFGEHSGGAASPNNIESKDDEQSN